MDTDADFLAPIELLQPIEALESLNLLTYSSPTSPPNQTAAPVALAKENPTKHSQVHVQEESKIDSSAKENVGPQASNVDASSLLAGSERGCYLTFDPVSEGTLFMTWSETWVDGALAFIQPGKTVPAFKFKRNGGKNEIIRNLRGTGMKRYLQGVTQFVKLGLDFKGKLIVFDHSKSTFTLYRLTESNQVQTVKLDTLMESSEFRGVAAIAPHNTIFEGVETMTQGYFAGTGNKEGAALLF